MVNLQKTMNIIIYCFFTIIIIIFISYLIFLLLITPNSVSRFYHNHLSYYFTEPSIETQIIDYVEKTCPHQDRCRINLAQAMPFKWDQAYILYPNRISTIEKLTHNSIKIPPASTNTLLLLFIKNRKMIRYSLSDIYDVEQYCVDDPNSYMECYVERKKLFLNIIDNTIEYSPGVIQLTPNHSTVEIEKEEKINQSGVRSTEFILDTVKTR